MLPELSLSSPKCSTHLTHSLSSLSLTVYATISATISATTGGAPNLRAPARGATSLRAQLFHPLVSWWSWYAAYSVYTSSKLGRFATAKKRVNGKSVAPSAPRG